MWKVTFHKKNKIKDAILIEGLPGIGNVGKVAVDYLISQYEAQKIISFFSHNLPNTVFVNENNLVELPKIEIYHKKIEGQDFLFLAGDVQPTNEKSSYQFCETVLTVCEKYGLNHVVTLGGIGLGETKEKPKVYCTGNDQEIVEFFKKNGANNNIYGLVGPIIGVSGLLLGLSTTRKKKASTLLAETFSHPMYLGLKEAKEILMVLKKAYDFKLDFKELNKEIKLLERELSGEKVESKTLERLKKIKEINYIG